MYLPYLGFFDKIRKADLFVIADNFQFSKGYYYNRNKIKSPNGELILTVPLEKSSSMKPINEIRISNTKNWGKNHFQNISLYYKKADYFDEYINFFENIYNTKWDMLCDLNITTIMYLLEQLNIDIPIYYTSDLLKNYCFVDKSQKLVDICQKLGADTYLSGISGKDYIETKTFVDNQIKIEFQNYVPKQYKQLWGQFLPNLSVVDLLFNLGEEAYSFIA